MNLELNRIVAERAKEYGKYSDVCEQVEFLKHHIYFDFKYVFDGENYIMPIKLFKDYPNKQTEIKLKCAVSMGKTMMALKAIRSLTATKQFKDCVYDFINYHNLTQEVFDDCGLGHMVISFDEEIFNPVLNDGLNNLDLEELGYLVDKSKVKSHFVKFLERKCNE